MNYLSTEVNVIDRKRDLLKMFFFESAKVIVIAAALYTIFPMKDDVIEANNTELTTVKQALTKTEIDLENSKIEIEHVRKALEINEVQKKELQERLDNAIIPESTWKDVWANRVR